MAPLCLNSLHEERPDLVEKYTTFLEAQWEAHQALSAFAEGPARWQRGELYESDACFIGFESHQGAVRHQELAFFGAIDEVRVFDRALSPDEIRLLAGPTP